MKSLIGSLIGLVLSVSVSAEPLLEGQVRLLSGQPAGDVQVRPRKIVDGPRKDVESLAPRAEVSHRRKTHLIF